MPVRLTCSTHPGPWRMLVFRPQQCRRGGRRLPREEPRPVRRADRQGDRRVYEGLGAADHSHAGREEASQKGRAAGDAVLRTVGVAAGGRDGSVRQWPTTVAASCTIDRETDPSFYLANSTVCSAICLVDGSGFTCNAQATNSMCVTRGSICRTAPCGFPCECPKRILR